VVILRLAPVNIYAGDEPAGAAMQHACADALRWRSWSDFGPGPVE
jgi:hypothetical protein